MDDWLLLLSQYIPLIGFVFMILGIMFRLALKKNNEHINKTVSAAEGRICSQISGVKKEITDTKNEIKNIRGDVERHERWFEQFFKRYLTGITDVKHREFMKRYKEGDTNELS